MPDRVPCAAVLTQTPLDLSRIFELRVRDIDIFEGDCPDYAWGSAYGGLLAAQAQWAATMTVPEELSLHSLHAYFLRAGKLGEPVRYRVERLRDGRSFQTRRVTAVQSSGEALSVLCSFQRGEESPVWQSPEFPSDLPAPDAVDGHWDAGIDRRDAVFAGDPPRVATWMRYPAELEDDPRLRACALTYLSDLNPIDAGVAAHPTPPADGQWSSEHVCVSLDHAIWFHAPVRSDDWVLLDSRGQRFAGNRALATGNFYSRDGAHLATVAQEALLRPRT